jgi:hypothetical protein
MLKRVYLRSQVLSQLFNERDGDLFLKIDIGTGHQFTGSAYFGLPYPGNCGQIIIVKYSISQEN